mgnify:FL=1
MSTVREAILMGAKRVICGLVSISIVAQPMYAAYLTAMAVGLMSSPMLALAQTPPPRPPGSQEGEDFGRSLITGPTTDGTSIYFQGQSGTESIDAVQLFQSSGSQDDVEAMMDAFGDHPAALAISSADAGRMEGEASAQAEAVRTVRDSATSRSHPDMSTDPSMVRSMEILDGDDPIFDTFFGECESVEIPTGSGSSTHVEDLRFCNRVVLPEESCEVVHEYDAGLVQLIGGDGGVASCGPGCLDVFVGRVGNNYWAGRCTIFEQNVSVQVDNPAAITSARLEQAIWDDYMQIYLADNLVWQGPNANFPPETGGPCELRTNWNVNPGVDLTAAFQEEGVLNFRIRVSVYGNGEGYARIRLLYDEAALVTQDQWYYGPECEALIGGINDGACQVTELQCVDGPAMDVPCININGFPICQEALSPGPLPGYSSLCRRGTINANCRPFNGELQCFTDAQGVLRCPVNDGGNPNGCAQFESNPQCAFVRSTCLPGAMGDSGTCYAWGETWDCGYDVGLPGGSTTTITCDGPIRCMGDECITPTRETNPDFAAAAGALTAMTFMSMEMDCPDNNLLLCEIFAGEAMECKQALGGYQDCCNMPVGVSLSDYLQLTMASYDLAQKMQLGEILANAGMNVPGAWSAIQNFAAESWSTITQPFTSAWGSLTQSYGGAAVEAIESFSLEALKREMVTATAEFVAETFGAEVAGMFFGGTTDAATGEFIANGALSEGFAAVLNVIAWVYAIYLILNILIDIIWECEEEEFMLSAKRELQSCNRLGQYCASDSVFGCVETRDVYCCYDSPLARIVMGSATTQFAIDTGPLEEAQCPGLTIEQLQALDWEQVDLEQWYGILAANGVIPQSAPQFDTDYALDNVTRNTSARFPAPSAPERIQDQVDAAEYFDEAREDIREDLWSTAGD